MGICGCSQPKIGGCTACNPGGNPSWPVIPGPLQSAPQMGWRCPGCGACYAPTMMQCIHCGPRHGSGVGAGNISPPTT